MFRSVVIDLYSFQRVFWEVSTEFDQFRTILNNCQLLIEAFCDYKGKDQLIFFDV